MSNTSIEFTFIDAYGIFDCPNHIEKQNFQLTITPKSTKLRCQLCGRTYLYRIVQVNTT